MIHLTKKALLVTSHHKASAIVPIDPQTECDTVICDLLYTRQLNCVPNVVNRIRLRIKYKHRGARRLSITQTTLGRVALTRTITQMVQP